MSVDAREIEQIVVRVLERLQDTGATSRTETPNDVPLFSLLANAPKSVAAPQQHQSSHRGVKTFSEPVLTQEILKNALNGATQIRIGPRTVLTPSARDYLKTSGIVCIREQPAASNSAKDRWQAIVAKASSQAASAVENLRASGAEWEYRLSGTTIEAAQQAVSTLCRGESTGIVVFAEQPELVACIANRTRRIRAAAVCDVTGVASAKGNLGVNLLVINPVGKSVHELKNLLKTFTAGGAPVPPTGWND